ncbi:hypothetical protein [Mesorhizobium sp. KR2-14]|uniref:hypothetical protein n=1 Tax=Mesorhizobium sp. KR2-14 TaxID=3156610 RepID=UPI0032B5845A
MLKLAATVTYAAPANHNQSTSTRHSINGLAQQQLRSGTLHRGDLSVPGLLSRHRHQPVVDDRAVHLHSVGCRLGAEHASVPDGRLLFLLPVILMYTGWSYWVFRGKVRTDIGYIDGLEIRFSSPLTFVSYQRHLWQTLA